MWLKDTSATAGIIWNWWAHSRALNTPAASLSSTIRPIQVEPLSSGWMYPAAFMSVQHYPSMHLYSLFSSSHSHTSLSHWDVSTVTLWPAAETGCLRAAVPAPDSASGGKLMSVILLVICILQSLDNCIHFKLSSKPELFSVFTSSVFRFCLLITTFTIGSLHF